MITITNKTDCGGCGACASRCVTSCITMAPDEEGFNYPLVDTDKCIHCGLCERVCPLLHKPQPHEILAVIGCKNKNEALCQLQRRFFLPRCRKNPGTSGDSLRGGL